MYEVMLDCWNLDHRLRPKFDEIGKELDTLLKNNFQSARRYVREARYVATLLSVFVVNIII